MKVSVHPFRRRWLLKDFPVGRTPIKSAPSRGDLDTHLTNGSLGPPESATQTASRSAQPSLQGSRMWPIDRQTDRPRYSVWPLSLDAMRSANDNRWKSLTSASLVVDLLTILVNISMMMMTTTMTYWWRHDSRDNSCMTSTCKQDMPVALVTCSLNTSAKNSPTIYRPKRG